MLTFLTSRIGAALAAAVVGGVGIVALGILIVARGRIIAAIKEMTTKIVVGAAFSLAVANFLMKVYDAWPPQWLPF